MGTNQVYWTGPAAYNNSPSTTQAACASQNWNSMSFPLPANSVECTGEMGGSVAGLGSTDTRLSLDNLELLAYQSILEASCHNFSGGEAIVTLELMFKHLS